MSIPTTNLVVIVALVFVMSVFGAVMEMRARRKRKNIFEVINSFRKRK